MDTVPESTFVQIRLWLGMLRLSLTLVQFRCPSTNGPPATRSTLAGKRLVCAVALLWRARSLLYQRHCTGSNFKDAITMEPNTNASCEKLMVSASAGRTIPIRRTCAGDRNAVMSKRGSRTKYILRHGADFKGIPFKGSTDEERGCNPYSEFLISV